MTRHNSLNLLKQRIQKEVTSFHKKHKAYRVIPPACVLADTDALFTCTSRVVAGANFRLWMYYYVTNFPLNRHHLPAYLGSAFPPISLKCSGNSTALLQPVRPSFMCKLGKLSAIPCLTIGSTLVGIMKRFSVHFAGCSHVEMNKNNKNKGEFNFLDRTIRNLPCL